MNVVAIVIAVIVSMALGSLWFSPVLFSKKWIEWEGHTAGQGMGSGGSLPTGTTTPLDGALIGLYAGIGFVAPAIFADHPFNNRRGALFLIVAGYPVVGLAIMGAILGALR
jgi:hypothetical protein